MKPIVYLRYKGGIIMLNVIKIGFGLFIYVMLLFLTLASIIIMSNTVVGFIGAVISGGLIFKIDEWLVI